MKDVQKPKDIRVRTEADFRQSLSQQLRLLENACRGFDEGDQDQVLNIATRLRVLLRDAKNPRSKTKALLTLVGIKDKLRFIDSGLYRDRLEKAALAAMRPLEEREVLVIPEYQFGLVEMGRVGNGPVGWYAPLAPDRSWNSPIIKAALRPPQPFESWWNDGLIETSNGHVFSRADVVGIIADNDGGAHVDEEIAGVYEDFKVDFYGVEVGEGYGAVDPALEDFPFEIRPVENNVAYASVRQIAYEVLATLQLYDAPKLIPGAFVLAQPELALPIQSKPHVATYPALPWLLVTKAEDDAVESLKPEVG